MCPDKTQFFVASFPRATWLCLVLLGEGLRFWKEVVLAGTQRELGHKESCYEGLKLSKGIRAGHMMTRTSCQAQPALSIYFPNKSLGTENCPLEHVSVVDRVCRLYV